MRAMLHLLVFVLSTTVFLANVEGQVVNPWVDTTSCLPTDTPSVCSLKKKQCSPINDILKPAPTTPAAGTSAGTPAGGPSAAGSSAGKGGLLGALTTCANMTGTVIPPTFFMTVGLSFAQGKPESLIDSLSADPSVSSSIRFCVLNSTGLIGTDLQFNRSAAILAVSQQPLGPNVMAPVMMALLTCPEPLDYSIGPFMSCLRAACMANATATFPAWTAPAAGGPAKKKPAGAASPFAGGPYGAVGGPMGFKKGPVGAAGGVGASATGPGMPPEVSNFLTSLLGGVAKP